MRIHWKKTEKNTLFFETDCFIQTGGREDKGYSADLVVQR